MNVLHHISLSAIVFLLPLLLQQEPSSSAIILSLKKRHGSSGNQYSSSRPSSFQGNRSTCSLFMGTWVHDDSYPLYKPADCPAVVEGEFDCLMYGRPDSNYLKYRWQPQNCNLPTYVYSFLGFCKVCSFEFDFIWNLSFWQTHLVKFVSSRFSDGCTNGI